MSMPLITEEADNSTALRQRFGTPCAAINWSTTEAESLPGYRPLNLASCS